jgi:hypothetical protein
MIISIDISNQRYLGDSSPELTLLNRAEERAVEIVFPRPARTGRRPFDLDQG